MVTAKGIGFLLVAATLLPLAWLTQVGWLYLVDAVLWGILLLSAALPWLSIAFIEGRRWVEPWGATAGRLHPAEGDPVRLTVELGNRTFWPRFFLTLLDDCPLAGPAAGPHRMLVTKLAGPGRISMSRTVEAHQRGLHVLGPVVVENSAPFGLFRRRARLAVAQPVLSWPAPAAICPGTRSGISTGATPPGSAAPW